MPWPLPVALRLPKRRTFSPVARDELVRRQLLAPLIEIVGDAHGADRVRTRWTWPYFVELLEHGQHRTLFFLDDIEVRRERRAKFRGRSLRGGALRPRFGCPRLYPSVSPPLRWLRGG